MKVRMPKSFSDLSKHDKDIIDRVCSEEIQHQVEKEHAEVQKLWLQFACIVLNRNFGFGKNRLLLFLGAWKEMYRINKHIQTKAEQTEYLTGELDRIFGKGGYPTKYIEKLEDIK